MNNSLIKVPNCSMSKQRKVDKLVQKASELGVEVTNENCGKLSDVEMVIYVITLMIWCEFKKKFIHYVEKNNLNFDREAFYVDFGELRSSHYVVTYRNNVFEIDKFVEEISESNSERVFKEVANYLGIEEK